jgi:ABC-type glycerol-3-phosphate transport system substrate-binding protein
MKNKLLCVLSALALMLLVFGTVFIGCKKKEGGEDKKLTLTLITNRTDRHQSGALAERIKPFEAANNCTVNIQSYTNYQGDVGTMMTTKNYGDILAMIPAAIKITDYGNFFEPYGNYDELKKKYNWLDSSTYNGLVYGIPDMGSIGGGLCYNKRIWKEAGITKLPTTPEEFIADLRLIKKNIPDVIPFYTLYNFSWCITQWNNLPTSVSGNPNMERDLLLNRTPIFDKESPYYKVFKLMFEVFADKDIHEPDPMTDDWEGSKPAINSGKIATMMMGSWAVTQFKQAGDRPEDIGYMPPPFNISGKQYAQFGGGGYLAINKNSAPEVKELAKKFVTWWVEESGWAQAEGGVPTVIGGALPDYLTDYSAVELFSTNPVPNELLGVFDEISKVSGVSPGTDETGNFKFQIADAAFSGKPWSYVESALIPEWNKKWMDTLNANEKLTTYKP